MVMVAVCVVVMWLLWGLMLMVLLLLLLLLLRCAWLCCRQNRRRLDRGTDLGSGAVDRLLLLLM